MIRQSRPEDRDTIVNIFDLAFSPSSYEGNLQKLVVAGEDYFEWVWEKDSKVVAAILYTSAFRDNALIGYHLAPVAVHPDLQNQGIGSELIRKSLNETPLCDSSVFVLGDPTFYERFGFENPEIARCPYDENNQHFRALRWDDEGEPFDIGYLPAFLDAES